MRKKQAADVGCMKYKTPEALQIAVDAYFTKCEGELATDDQGVLLMDDDGRPYKKHVQPMTMTGLALALGFTSKRGLLNYKYRPGFADVYSRALLRCESYLEAALYSVKTYNGAAFLLRRCYGWNGQKENDSTPIIVQIIQK